MRKVDNYDGIKIVLGKIPCVFEFKIYKYRYIQELPEASQQTTKNNPENNSPTTDTNVQSVIEKIQSLPPPPPTHKKNETCI